MQNPFPNEQQPQFQIIQGPPPGTSPGQQGTTTYTIVQHTLPSGQQAVQPTPSQPQTIIVQTTGEPGFAPGANGQAPQVIMQMPHAQPPQPHPMSFQVVQLPAGQAPPPGGQVIQLPPPSHQQPPLPQYMPPSPGSSVEGGPPHNQRHRKYAHPPPPGMPPGGFSGKFPPGGHPGGSKHFGGGGKFPPGVPFFPGPPGMNMAPPDPSLLPPQLRPGGAAGGIPPGVPTMKGPPPTYDPAQPAVWAEHGSASTGPGTEGEAQPALQLIALPKPELISIAPNSPLIPLDDPNATLRQDDGTGSSTDANPMGGLSLTKWTMLSMSSICKEFLSGRCKHLKGSSPIPTIGPKDVDHGGTCIYVHLPQDVRAFPQEVCRDWAKQVGPMLPPGQTGPTGTVPPPFLGSDQSKCRRPHCRMFHGPAHELEKARHMLTRYNLSQSCVFVQLPDDALTSDEPSLAITSLSHCVLVYAKKDTA